MTFRRIAALLVPLLALGCQQASETGDQQPAAPQIDADGDRIRAHIAFLADDLLEGRDAGTVGYDRAALYVATQMKLMGLQPGGGDGRYLQPVRFVRTTLDTESATAAIIPADEKIDLVNGTDFLMGGSASSADQTVTAPAVFVGFAVSAPQHGHDDFADIDLRGKIAVYLSGAPASFPASERAYYSSRGTKARAVRERGAVGTVTINSPVDEQRRPFARLARFLGRPILTWLNPEGNPGRAVPGIEGSAMFSHDAAGRLLEGSGQSLEEVFAKAEAGEVNSFDIPASVTLSRKSSHEYITSPNVVGILEGSDPELKGEYVVYTAHLDHVGVQPSEGDDQLHNGAYDNASGTAVMLETAQVLLESGLRPRRSIIFAAVTAEEKGLLGSDYFAQYPGLPRGSLVANVNLDMPLLFYRPSDIVAWGAEHSSMGAAVEAATALEGMTVAPDPFPEQTIFIRSDQYRFVQQGIPAVMLWPGLTAADPEVDGNAQVGEFMGNHYHQPSDDLDLPFDKPAAELFTRVNLRIGLDVANGDARPVWNEGDFFGTTFGPRNHVAGAGDSAAGATE